MKRASTLRRKTPLARISEKRRARIDAREPWRRRCRERAGYYCERCGDGPIREAARLHPHHLIAEGSGGPDEDWNSVALCERCHANVHAGASDARHWIARDEQSARAIRARLDGSKKR